MTNNELKYYENLKRKKFRDSEDLFLIEGFHLIEECLKSKYFSQALKKLVVRNDYANDKFIKNIQSVQSHIEIVYLEKNKFKKLSETVNTQGIIGVVQKTSLKRKSKRNNLIVALDSINDPGNLGTIIRTCYWFDVDEILISKHSVELFNSKVIRATQGAMFNMIIKENQDLSRKLNKLSTEGFHIYLADSNGKQLLSDLKFVNNDNVVFVFGNEAHGISKELKRLKSFNTIRIKRNTQCESLNVGVSVGVVLNSYRN
ncbi:TrmH family RNA methyltransferase [Bacteroidota bacterium]